MGLAPWAKSWILLQVSAQHYESLTYATILPLLVFLFWKTLFFLQMGTNTPNTGNFARQSPDDKFSENAVSC